MPASWSVRRVLRGLASLNKVVTVLTVVAAAVWLVSGFLAQAGAAKRGAVQVNLWLHTGTIQID
jgi:hypothetical protein